METSKKGGLTLNPNPQHPLIENEDYVKNNLLKTMRKDPENVRMSMYYQFCDNYKEWR